MIKNLHLVNPVKREKVRTGMEWLEHMNQAEPVVQKVILFGSAVTADCTEESDIDLCLVTDSSCQNPVYFQIYGGLPIIMDDLCDILSYQKVNGKLKEEIDRKGVIVYELS